MTHVTLSVIGLPLYWQVAVFIGNVYPQCSFDPPTEAIVCHSLHPRPKSCGVWDICQILLDQRMTITQTGVHIPPTAAFDPCQRVRLKNTGWMGVTHMYAHKNMHTTGSATEQKHWQICFCISCIVRKTKVWFPHKAKFIKYLKCLGLLFCCSLAFSDFPTISFYNPFLISERMSWNSRRGVWCCSNGPESLLFGLTLHACEFTSSPLPLSLSNKLSVKL